jgi:hypothetical protein
MLLYFSPESRQIEANNNISQLDAISPLHVFILHYKKPVIYPDRFMLNVLKLKGNAN